MKKEQRRDFLWPWVRAVLLLLINRAYWESYHIIGGIFLVTAILISIWAIRKQYKKAQRMDRDCWLMVVLSVLFTILCIVILLI